MLSITDFKADLVTETDKEVENVIFKHLKLKFPNHSFFGEETSALSGDKIDNLTLNQYSWIIDPIDGYLFCV
jgi:fructose-1,6-bisphosphatase/inositol monophosphatase family enzyme